MVKTKILKPINKSKRAEGAGPKNKPTVHSPTLNSKKKKQITVYVDFAEGRIQNSAGKETVLAGSYLDGARKWPSKRLALF